VRIKKKIFAPLTIVGIVSSIVVIADQLSKIWVRHALPTNTYKIEIITNHLDFIHRKNPGIAFSLFASTKWAPFAFAAISVVAVIFIIRIIYKNKHLPIIVIAALGAIAGGATGNLTDRIIPPHKVIDFIDFYIGQWHWPTFNIADSFICIGAFLLIIASLIYRDPFSPLPSGDAEKKEDLP